MKLPDAAQKLKELSAGKKIKYLAIVLIIAVILGIYFSTLTPGQTQEPDAWEQADDSLELRLEQALSQMSGVGEVSVVINYDSTAERVPVLTTDTQSSTSIENEKSSESSTQRTEVATVQGEGALIVKENQPEVRGVIVVAEGAQDIGIRMNILSAVTTLLNVHASQVEILY